MIKILIFFLINLNLKFRISALEINGTNVCFRDYFPNSTEIIGQKYYEERNKCSYEFRFYRQILQCELDLEKKYLEIYLFCCDGYFESENKCELICKNGCVNGDCVGDSNNNTCINCALGFGGIDCNQTCTSARYYGLNCENDCNCILDPSCNKNYKLCICNSGVIENECKEICKCRGNCKPGLIGKKCDIKCPDFKFGNLCLNDCLCKKNNTKFCNNETGECKCSENYYGTYCEKYCPGNLKCSNSIDCICEKTMLQKIDHLKKESETVKNYFIYCIIITLISIILLIIVFIILTKIREKRIRNKLTSTIKYSNNDQVNNQIYISNLDTDNNIKSKDNLANKMNQSKLREKLENLKEKLFEKKDQNQITQNIYPNLIVVDSNIYSTISEDLKDENETIVDKISAT